MGILYTNHGFLRGLPAAFEILPFMPDFLRHKPRISPRPFGRFRNPPGHSESALSRYFLISWQVAKSLCTFHASMNVHRLLQPFVPYMPLSAHSFTFSGVNLKGLPRMTWVAPSTSTTSNSPMLPAVYFSPGLPVKSPLTSATDV